MRHCSFKASHRAWAAPGVTGAVDRVAVNGVLCTGHLGVRAPQECGGCQGGGRMWQGPISQEIPRKPAPFLWQGQRHAVRRGSKSSELFHRCVEEICIARGVPRITSTSAVHCCENPGSAGTRGEDNSGYLALSRELLQKLTHCSSCIP